MVLDRLIASALHDASLSSLHHLIAENTLEGRLQAFIIASKVEGLSKHTLNYYRYQVGAMVAFCKRLNITEPRQVTDNEIRLFVLTLQEHNNPVSVHDYFRANKRFFNWLVEQRVIKSSPFAGIKAPRVPKYIIKPLSQRDIAAILLLTDGDKFLQLRNRALVLMLLDTGMRLSEISSIRLADIDIDRGVLRVMGKGAKERLVRIGTQTQRALLQYLLKRTDTMEALWLTEERRPLTKSGVQMTIKVLCQRAGVTGAKHGPHAFRHTAATACLRNGMPETMVQNMLGHEDLRMTRRYTQTIGTDDMLRAHIKASPVDNLLK